MCCPDTEHTGSISRCRSYFCNRCCRFHPKHSLEQFIVSSVSILPYCQCIWFGSSLRVVPCFSAGKNPRVGTIQPARTGFHCLLTHNPAESTKTMRANGLNIQNTVYLQDNNNKLATLWLWEEYFFMCAKIALALTSWAYGLIMFYVLPFYTQKLPFQFWYLNFDLPWLKHNILIWHSVNSVINVFKNCKHNSGDATDLTIRPKWKQSQSGLIFLQQAEAIIWHSWYSHLNVFSQIRMQMWLHDHRLALMLADCISRPVLRVPFRVTTWRKC